MNACQDSVRAALRSPRVELLARPFKISIEGGHWQSSAPHSQSTLGSTNLAISCVTREEGTGSVGAQRARLHSRGWFEPDAKPPRISVVATEGVTPDDVALLVSHELVHARDVRPRRMGQVLSALH